MKARNRIQTLLNVGVPLFLLAFGRIQAAPLGSAFTYQGQLHKGGSPAHGSYDLVFRLTDAASGGNSVGNPLTNSATLVSNGAFSVTLDFGPGAFDGNARWLEVAVRPQGDGAFTPLAPLQQLMPSPHALFASQAGNAAVATSAASVAANDFDDNVTALNRRRMVEAMALWEAVANVDFRPKQSGDLIFTRIHSRDANTSTIGRIPIATPPGAPPLNQITISDWDWPFVIAHELGHTLGLQHEQTRPDRDQDVRIIEAITSGEGHNFHKHEDAIQYGPYDFGSVMHYRACAFSKCGNDACQPSDDACRTIVVLPPYDTQWQEHIGQRERL